MSVDIESDGPIPGPNSMLSFGAAAFIEGKGLISTFERNLETLPDAAGDPSTMQWWAKPENTAAWTAHRQNTIDPKQAMSEFVQWVRSLPGRPVFVGYPATYDFMFVHWYIVNYGLSDPFGFSALDMKSYAMAKLGTGFRETTKKSMPKAWFKEGRHTHVAIDDAIEQGFLFLEMLRATPRGL